MRFQAEGSERTGAPKRRELELISVGRVVPLRKVRFVTYISLPL